MKQDPEEERAFVSILGSPSIFSSSDCGPCSTLPSPDFTAWAGTCGAEMASTPGCSAGQEHTRLCEPQFCSLWNGGDTSPGCLTEL